MVRKLVFAGALLAACKGAQQPPLTIFNAAALGPPFRALGNDLVNRGLLGRVDLESSPSLEAVRKVTALGKLPDLLAVADLSLLDSIVLPTYSSWYLVFGSNALVLAYGPESAHRAGLSDSTWVDVLLTPGVRVGRSDPRVDPSGYRALLAVQLAERFYHRPGLAAAPRRCARVRHCGRAEALNSHRSGAGVGSTSVPHR